MQNKTRVRTRKQHQSPFHPQLDIYTQDSKDSSSSELSQQIQPVIHTSKDAGRTPHELRRNKQYVKGALSLLQTQEKRLVYIFILALIIAIAYAVIVYANVSL